MRGGENMGEQLPEDFICPISHEIMSDPVILSSGHTFDRSSIQRWLDSGHRTCPITRSPLPDHPSLTPNHALRRLISEYTQTTPDLEPQALISCLTSRWSAVADKLESLIRLGGRLRQDPGSRRRIAELGGVSAALRCVDSPDLQGKALILLLNLSLDNDNRAGLVAEGAIGHIVGLLERGGAPPDFQAVAATILTSLAVLDVNQATIGAYPGAIRALVSLIRDGSGRERREAATALYAICSFPENSRRAVGCGAVRVLIESGLEKAIEVLGLLAQCEEGREEMVNFDGVVDILVGMLNNGSPRVVQYALLTLCWLCRYCGRIRNEARDKGVMTICERLREDDNENIRCNAGRLAFELI